MTKHHLAQINVGRLVAPEGSTEVQEFFDSLDRVNALAEASPGFVWRLQSEAGNATDIKPTSDSLLIVNMSVWETPETLFAFVYKSDHTSVLAKRRDWFERPEGAYQALWWVPCGHVPSIEEGLSKLSASRPLRPDGARIHVQDPLRGARRRTSSGRHGPDPWCVGHA